MEKNREELIQGLEKLGITAGEEEVSKLISFSELLLKWNKVYNLTAIRDEGDVIRKHLLDSLTLLPYFKLYGTESVVELWTLGVAEDYLLFPYQSF